MHRPLSAEERALWAKVIATVRPLHRQPEPVSAPEPPAAPPPAPPARQVPVRAKPAPKPAPRPGETLDGSWDRRLARGVVQPDISVDLHGHNLAAAYDLLDRKLEQAVAMEARVVLLITGKPPTDDRRPVSRGAIRAAVGDWLASSRHAASIAAVRGAQPRHGGAGALYIVLRRRR
ncbi:Smr/MutS family protein [Allosphingosinicella sp.]|uniref:Smr/MutS family protein n=1 Tax=Allosphingosinicella sp. TaxID=2823234 RepID=UPI003D7151F4